MEILDLKIFCDLIELKSFTESARQNCLTQSAVSQRINRLNDKFGNRLFLDRKRLILSEHGKYLYDKFSDILKIYSHTENFIQKQASREVLSIGLSGNAKDKYFGEKFLEKLFEMDYIFELYFGSSQSIHEKVLFGSLDYGIVGSSPLRFSEIVSNILYTENIFLATSKNNTVKKVNLMDIPIVLDHRDSGLYHFLKKSLASKNINFEQLKIKCYLGTSIDKITLLVKGKYYAFLPEWYIKNDPKLQIINLGFTLTREFYEIYQKFKINKVKFLSEFIRNTNIHLT